ncbi:MAG: oligosaccharide flippase family protein [Betaproteobacteria bacterium]|nr:oligosaccharide flippase family protein [Betaproteobacteria bacterium]
MHDPTHRAMALFESIRRRLRDPLWSSTAALGGLQVVSLLIPLITLPYLVRVLGPAAYGELALCLSVIAYLTLLADMGYGISAVRGVASKRDDPRAMARLCSAITLSRLGTGATACAALILGLHLLPITPAFAGLLLLAAPMIPFSMLNMNWYFQGMQRLHLSSLAQALVRLTGLAMLFALVHTPRDLPRAVGIEVFMAAAGSLCTWLLLLPRVRLLLGRPSRQDFSATFAESFRLFVATLGSTLYTNGLTLVLGMASTRTEVGLFAIADRITFAIERLMHPLQQALYPHVNALRARSSHAAFDLLRTLLRNTVRIGIPATLLFALIAPLLVHWAGGSKAAGALPPLLIMTPQPLLIALSTLIGVQGLLSFGQSRPVALVQWCVGVAMLLLAWPAARWGGSVGVSLVSTASEIVIAALYFRASRRHLHFP